MTEQHMKRLYRMAAAITLLAGASAARGESMLEGAEVLREPLASLADDAAITLRAEPVAGHVLAPPAVMLHRAADDRVAAPVVLEAALDSSASADVELQLVYTGDTPFAMARREAIPGVSVVRWLVPQDDRLTSATLTLRSVNPATSTTVSGVSLRPLRELSLGEQLESWQEEPLAPLVLAPVRNDDDKLEALLRLAWPAESHVEMLRHRVELHWPDGRMPVSLPLESEQGALGREVTITVPLTDPMLNGSTEFRAIAFDNEGAATLLGATVYTPLEVPVPSFELPSRSIEDFHALVRNGELVIYATIGLEGNRRAASGAPLPTEGLWVAVGNGRDWVLTEPAIRTRRNVPWMAGGMHAFGAVEAGANVHSYFATAFASGEEAWSHANSVNSLKVAPVAANPLWQPPAESSHAAPRIRGNAVYQFGDARAVLVLTRPTAGPPEVRTMASSMRTRFMDLGTVALEGFPADAEWMNGTQHDGEYLLLAGPPARLYTSTDPIRTWRPLQLDDAPAWEDMQLLHWTDKWWLFGIAHVGGRGVVTWCPLERDGDQFRAVLDYAFEPPPLQEQPIDESLPLAEPPPPPLMRPETDVR